MDTTQCPFCAEIIKKAAIKCKHCHEKINVNKIAGYDSILQENKVKTKKPINKSKFVTIVLGSFIILSILGHYTPDRKDTKTEKSETERDYTAIVCADTKRYIKSTLRSPSTAKFPFFGCNATKIDAGTYKVTTYVDAQNGFGAEIRTNFTCTAKGSGENWRISCNNS